MNNIRLHSLRYIDYLHEVTNRLSLFSAVVSIVVLFYCSLLPYGE